MTLRGNLSGFDGRGLALLHALNEANAVATSSLSPSQFQSYVETAFTAIGQLSPPAFLIAFDQAADIASPNFAWFRRRYARFVYVDRIVVDAAGRGQGIASQLYAQLFERAAAAGHDTVGCEVNSDPPNPASDAFRAKLGFEVIGSAHLAERGKTVTYLCRRLARS